MTKHPAHPTGRSDGGPAGQAGMTLMELLVSLAILSIMILMANSLLVSSRRTIGLAQDAIKANADVRAVAGRLRAEIAGATKEGFLAIAYDVNDLPHLVFTSAGTYRSVLDASVANAAVIDFGLTNDTNRVFWRRAWLQDPNIPQVTNDRYPGPLAVWRNIAQPRPLIGARLGLFTDPAMQPALTLPVDGLAAARDLWPYLIADVRALKIQWTNGVPDVDGRLVWYDRENPYRVDTNGNPVWPRVDAGEQDLAPPLEDVPEFNLSGADAAPELYCALWTFKKKSTWPKAIRFELSVGDPPRLFEVVVSLPN